MREWLESDWFEWLAIVLAVVLGYFLWMLLIATQPDGSASPVIQLAFSLASGNGYSLPGNGMAAFNIPPLYPLMLAGFTKLLASRRLMDVIHTSIPPYQLLNLGLYVFSVFQLYFIGRKLLPRPWNWILATVYAISPTVLLKATEPSGEMAFVVFSLLALQTIAQLYSDRDVPVSSWQRVWCCGWMAAAILTRNIGFVLPLAYLIMMARRRELQDGLFTVLFLVLAVLPWSLTEVYYRNLEQVPGDTQPTRQLTLPTSLKDSKWFARQIGQNMETALSNTTQGTLGNFSLKHFDGNLFRKLQMTKVQIPFSRMSWVRWILGGLIAAGVFLGFQIWPGLLSTYLVSFLVVTILFPVDTSHLLMPVLPLLLLHLFLGVQQIGIWVQNLGFDITRYLMPILVCLIVVNDINGHLENIRNAHVLSQQTLFLQSDTPMEQALRHTVEWIRGNTGIQSRIMSQPHEISWFAGRPLVAFPRRSNNLEAMMKTLMQADYILDEPNDNRDLLSPLIQKYPANFKNVYEDTKAKIIVWQVLR